MVTIHDSSITGEKPHACRICGKCFKYIEYLRSHFEVHENEKPYRCSACDRQFNRVSNTKSHEMGDFVTYGKEELLHSGEISKSRVDYVHCGKKYQPNICKLNIHERIHTGEKTYEYNKCDKRFTQKPHLESHHKLHITAKSFKCISCEKQFRHKCNLKRHETIHTS